MCRLALATYCLLKFGNSLQEDIAMRFPSLHVILPFNFPFHPSRSLLFPASFLSFRGGELLAKRFKFLRGRGAVIARIQFWRRVSQVFRAFANRKPLTGCFGRSGSRQFGFQRPCANLAVRQIFSNLPFEPVHALP